MLPESPLLGLNCFGLILVMNENAYFRTASPAWCLVRLLDICQYYMYPYLNCIKHFNVILICISVISEVEYS